MEAFPFLLVALLALCMMPSAFALQCSHCWRGTPVEPGTADCDSDDVPKRTCPQYWDRCLTLTAVIANGSTQVEVISRNCTSTFGCDPKGEYYACNYLDTYLNVSTPAVYTTASCKVDCCPDDLCNVEGRHSRSTTVVLAASFGAILFALVLTVLV